MTDDLDAKVRELVRTVEEAAWVVGFRAGLEDVLGKIVGDDEWWEEVRLSPYDGDVRRALRDALDDAIRSPGVQR